MKISKNIIANMRIIEYIKLFNYLKDVEELEGMDVIRTIYRLRKVSKELLNGVDLILQGKEPDITNKTGMHVDLYKETKINTKKELPTPELLKKILGKDFNLCPQCRKGHMLIPNSS